MYQVIIHTAPSIVFGMDTVDTTGEEAKKLSLKRILLVSGPNVQKAGIVERVEKSLKSQNIEVMVKIEGRSTPEPEPKAAEEAAESAREMKADGIIGLGGGSVLDVAKMSSVLLTNPLKVRDYFGREKVPNRGIPTIMIPTTSGTGAEVTKHAIFLDEQANVKKAVASSALLPNVAIIDPMLTFSCPPSVTASAGIDAWLHAVEPYISNRTNPITDNLAINAITLITKSLARAYYRGDDLDARYDMSLGSLMAGMVLNNAGTSLVHALAYPIGGEFHISHGLSLTPLLLSCFEYIIAAKQERFKAIALAMGENVNGLSDRNAARVCLEAIRDMLLQLDLPICLNDVGLTDKSKADKWAIGAIAEQRLLSRAPRILSVEDIKKIYLNAFSR